MQEKEIHLSDYLRIINKRRYYIVAFTIIVFAIVAIVTFNMTPQYRATTKLIIEDMKQDSLSRDSRESRKDPEFRATQYEIIKSKSVARKVVKQLSLNEKYASYFVNNENGKSAKKAGLKSRIRRFFNTFYVLLGMKSPSAWEKMTDSDKATAMEDAITDLISNNIQVIPYRRSRIIDISFSTQSPTLSSIIVNAIAKAYMDEILDIRLNIANYKLNWMNEKAEAERGKLGQSEKELQTYMQSKNIITVEGRIAIIPQKLSELSSQLILAETKRKELEALYNKVSKMDTENGAAMPSIASNQSLVTLKDSILKTEQSIIELSKKYGKNHPAMIKAHENLDGLQKLQQQEIINITQTIKNDYELALLNEKNLQKSLERTKVEAVKLNERFIQYNVLKREVETNRGLYETLIRKLKEQNIIGEIQTVNVWVLEKAKKPDSPYKPKKKLYLFLGLMVGIAGGVAFAFFVEYLDPTIKTPDEVEDRLGMPILGTVFFVKQKKKQIIDSMIENPNSAFAERYKAIRTSIMLSSVDHTPKSLLVTSPSPNDGKTMTAVNLSLAMVQFKHKVLLIDADLRNSQIHHLFGLDNNEGLSTYAAGVVTEDIIKEGPLPNLHIITSGPKPPNPSETISSKRILELIEQMSQKYDMLIFDSAPVIHVTDTLVLSKIVDGTVLVTRAGQTNYDMARNCIKSLKDINARLLGVIFNALNVKESGYYRYYGDYDYTYTSKDE